MAVAAGSGALVAILSGSALAGIVVLISTIVLSLIVSMTSLRTVVIAAAIIIVPPGALGESNLLLTTLGVTMLLGIVLSYPKVATPSFGHKFIIGAVFALAAGGMVVLHIPQYVYLYGVLGIVAVLASTRPAFFENLCLAIAIVLAALVVSYAVTLLTNFMPLGKIDLGRRVLEIYFPFTPATGGPPIFSGTRRLAPLTGEPGLTIFYLVPLLAFVVSRGALRPPARMLVAVIIFLVAIFSQSLATLLAVALAGFVYLATALALHRRFLSACFASIAALVVGVPAVGSALDAKEGAAAGSVADRTIGDGGNALGNINLIVAWVNTPALAVILSLALVVLLVISARSLAGVVAWTAFAITAISAQPSQWELGGWLFIAAAVSYGANCVVRDRDREARPMPTSPWLRSRPPQALSDAVKLSS